MADGDSTGTRLSDKRKAEIEVIFELLNKYIAGHCPKEIYKENEDIAIETCLVRLPLIQANSCCGYHYPIDCWQDGLLIGVLMGALGIIPVEVKADA